DRFNAATRPTSSQRKGDLMIKPNKGFVMALLTAGVVLAASSSAFATILTPGTAVVFSPTDLLVGPAGTLRASAGGSFGSGDFAGTWEAAVYQSNAYGPG